MDLKAAVKKMADGVEFWQDREGFRRKCRFSCESGEFEFEDPEGWRSVPLMTPHATYERVEPEPEAADDVPEGFEAWGIERSANWGSKPYIPRPNHKTFTLDNIQAEHGFAGWVYREPETGIRRWKSYRPGWWDPRIHAFYDCWCSGRVLVRPDCVLMEKEASQCT